MSNQHLKKFQSLRFCSSQNFIATLQWGTALFGSVLILGVPPGRAFVKNIVESICPVFPLFVIADLRLETFFSPSKLIAPERLENVISAASVLFAFARPRRTQSDLFKYYSICKGFIPSHSRLWSYPSDAQPNNFHSILSIENRVTSKRWEGTECLKKQGSCAVCLR